MHRLRHTVKRPDPSRPGTTIEVKVAPQWVRTAKGGTRKLRPGDTCDLDPSYVKSLDDLVEPVAERPRLGAIE